ncbi:sulfite reductase subunit alpha [Duganella qianjiadongensis]|uniref:NADPH--hemoprotein reductase n=1 Tax=Duganella qianjiadongensis TaxID=2692176 RepID=A0ABW9VFC8_9BURK|nr:sulfite reductase subunit alpha [Duganella qianjiadongensis]MYM38314.1 oxidoreductase [Duganella qianjiadongensis]
MIWTLEPVRWLMVATLGLLYALLCWRAYLPGRRKRQQARLARAAAQAAGASGWIVAHASQTGNAELLAQQTAATLQLAGIATQVLELAELDAATLQQAERALFIVSTYGEGDAPDAAAGFVARVMSALPAATADPAPASSAGVAAALERLHYAVLALGDTSYRQYCGFGRAIDVWLQQRAAQPLFARIEVDRMAPAALAAWRQQLSHLAGTSDAPDWSAPAFEAWQLARRVCVNPGSAGAPLYHLELVPQQGALPLWESGDLVQIAAPAAPEQPREYSIASIPADGSLHLLVRLHSHADGSHGVASGWLTQQAQAGQAIALRVRAHRRFRLEDNHALPLILIGNGSGIAGLRAHLKARALAGQTRNWLLFGERNAAFDGQYGAELAHWQAQGVLQQLDLVYSRDQAERRYVQHVLAEQAQRLRDWVHDGAAIYVCGSLEGMAAGVHAALLAALGAEILEQLQAAGRYRRDVY